ncbi:MAG: hypothetical protein PHN16_05195 [Candidatus Omnitrophica bacterium]|nr:hypothetical protein [Candidatus Omnitrophota bacterium]
MSKRLNTVIMGICLAIGAVFCCRPLWAESLPFMNQSKIRLSIPAGQRAFGEITLDNPSDEVKIVHLYLEDWYYQPDGSGAKEFLPANSLPSSACSWITFSPTDLVLPAFGKQKINYAVSVPPGAKGERFATLFFETALGKGELASSGRSAGLDVNVRVATLFYIEVKDTVERSAKIDNLKVKPSADGSGALEISLDFENTGNSDITTSGNFNLMNSEGLVSARGAFNSVYTLGGGKGVLSSAWKEKIPAGEYDLVVTVDLGKALTDAGLEGGPVITKEASVTIGENNQVVRVGPLK